MLTEDRWLSRILQAPATDWTAETLALWTEQLKDSQPLQCEDGHWWTTHTTVCKPNLINPI